MREDVEDLRPEQVGDHHAIVHTDRLVLRPVQRDDLAAVWAIAVLVRLGFQRDGEHTDRGMPSDVYVRHRA